MIMTFDTKQVLKVKKTKSNIKFSQKFYVWLRIIDRKFDWPQLNISFAFSSFSVCCKSLLSIEYCIAELFKNKVHIGFAQLIINYSKELTEAQLKL